MVDVNRNQISAGENTQNVQICIQTAIAKGSSLNDVTLGRGEGGHIIVTTCNVGEKGGGLKVG